MTRKLPIAAAVAALSAAYPGAVAADAAPAPAAPGPAGAVAEGMTRLVYEIDDCEGCRVQLTNARAPQGETVPRVWQSKVKEVEDGEVRFVVGTRRTWGVSVSLEAPWEGRTGYRTLVVQRYRGQGVGDRVSFREARHSGVASSCWAGTRRDEVRTKVVARRVQVAGVEDRVPGTIAFTRVTQDWHEPMRRSPGGVLGTQDADICH